MQKQLSGLASRVEIAASEAPYPLRIVDRISLGAGFGAGGKLASAPEGGFRLFGAEALRPHQRLTICGLKLDPPFVPGRIVLDLVSRRSWICGRLLRHRDRCAEMGDRLLEGRAAQSVVARLAPPFDRLIVEASLREMIGDHFRLRRRALGLAGQDFGGAPVQCLPAALEQAFVGGVLDQRVLELVDRARREE